MGNWYKVYVNRAHLGAGKNLQAVAYIFAKDIMGVLDRHRRMSGVKRNPNMHSLRFPTIERLSHEEESCLEQSIMRDSPIPLKKLKKTWYYDPDKKV